MAGTSRLAWVQPITSAVFTRVLGQGPVQVVVQHRSGGDYLDRPLLCIHQAAASRLHRPKEYD